MLKSFIFQSKIVMSLLLLSFVALGAEGIKLRSRFVRPGEALKVEYTGDARPAVVVQDWYGAKKTVTADKPALPTQKEGYYEIFVGDKRADMYVVISAPPERDTEKSNFGVHFHPELFGPQDMKKSFELAKFIGVDWARGKFILPFCNTKDSDYAAALKRQAAHIQVARESGMHILALFLDFPLFLNGEKEGGDKNPWLFLPEDLTGVKEFMRAYAEACPFIRHWEIGNETDTTYFWNGRRRSNGEAKLVIRDYVDWLAAVKSVAVEKGISVHYAGVCPTVEGAVYRPFLTTTMELDAWKYYDYMGVHYDANIPYIRSVMKKYNAPDVPLWVTETGDSSFIRETGKIDHHYQIRTNITQEIDLLADGAEKVFMYCFTKINWGGKDSYEGHYTIMTSKFEPKPVFVALATMIRYLTNAKYSDSPNLVRHASKGWLKARRFLNNGKDAVTVLWLNDAKNAVVSLKAEPGKCRVIDVMGNEVKTTVKNGVMTFDIDDLPVFLLGTYQADPGVTKFPGEVVVKVYDKLFKNTKFEDRDLRAWKSNEPYDASKYSIKLVRTGLPQGSKQAARVEMKEPCTTYYPALYQEADISKLMENLKPNERVIYTVPKISYKFENVEGGLGVAVEFDQRDKDGKRLTWHNLGGFKTGSHDWMTADFPSRIALDPRCRTVAIRFLFAPKSKGVLWADEAQVILTHWRKETLKK